MSAVIFYKQLCQILCLVRGDVGSYVCVLGEHGRDARATVCIVMNDGRDARPTEVKAIN